MQTTSAEDMSSVVRSFHIGAWMPTAAERTSRAMRAQRSASSPPCSAMPVSTS